MSRAARLIFSHTSASRARRGRFALALASSAVQAFADPAIDAVDEGRQRHPVAAAERVPERMQFARIDLRQRRQQCRGPLVKFDGVTTEQRQRARDASLRSLRRLRERGIVDRDVGGLRRGA